MYQAEKDYWRDWAQDAQAQGSPLYARLARAIDDDAALKALTQKRRPGQPPANLLLAAVHYLLLRGARHPLRALYPSVGGVPDLDAVYPLFCDFVAAHEDAVRALIETRVTNTNEVGRSAILRAGFGALALRESAPLHLIEIGPSAGLNLIWDRYGVRYRRGEAIAADIAPDASLRLDCDLRGAGMPPLAMPPIASRLGLELHPVDLSRDEDRDWLRALVWPDQLARQERLDRAIDLFRAAPVEIRGGDALALLPEALAAAPPGEALCVYHTIAVYQFSAAMKEALAAILAVAGLRRPVWHLAFEFDGDSGYGLTLAHHRDGLCDSYRLARAQPHGDWLEWLA